MIDVIGIEENCNWPEEDGVMHIYYRDITHLAKNQIDKEIDEAWQFITVVLENKIALPQSTKEVIDCLIEGLVDDIHKDDIIKFRKGDKWFEIIDSDKFAIDDPKIKRQL